jgi:hypothetical protein
MQHLWVRGDVNTGFLWGYLRERDRMKDTRRRWEDSIKMDLLAVGCRNVD